VREQEHHRIPELNIRNDLLLVHVFAAVRTPSKHRLERPHGITIYGKYKYECTD